MFFVSFYHLLRICHQQFYIINIFVIVIVRIILPKVNCFILNWNVFIASSSLKMLFVRYLEKKCDLIRNAIKYIDKREKACNANMIKV